MSEERTDAFKRNPRLEELLDEINQILAEPEAALASTFQMPRYPVVFVVGAPRTCTTLTMQWLAATGQFAYPTNLLSRFYTAPAIGARIQRLLTDPVYNFNNEILDFNRSMDFASNLGKTQGALAPNEFWYFWRRFIPNVEPRYLTPQEERRVDGAGFAAELAAIEAVFELPLAMKGMILQFNIPALSKMLDKALFIHVKRHPFYNMQSLLEARVKYFDDRDTWYSVRPEEYEWLKERNCFAQVAGQIHYTNKAVEDGLAVLPPERGLTLSYEEFCADPKRHYGLLVEQLASQGCEIDETYQGKDAFKNTNQVRVCEADAEAICAGYEEITGNKIKP